MKQRVYLPILLIGLICSILFCSCGKDDVSEDVSYGDKMKVSPYRIQIPKTNRAGVKVTLTSPCQWTSSCGTGVKCNPSTGTAGKTVVTVNRTGTTSKKEVLIHFIGSDGRGTSLGVELTD